MSFSKVSRGKPIRRMAKGPIATNKKDAIQDKQIQAVKKQVHAIVRKEELKYNDILLSAQPTSAGVFTLLNGMTIGGTPITRVGNDLTATSIQWRLRIVGDPDAVAQGHMVRHMIIWDQQANGSVPTVGQILDLAIISLAVIAPYNRNTQKRFKILEDSTYVLNANQALTAVAGSTTVVLSQRQHHEGKKSVSRLVKYTGSSNAIADISTNAMWSIILADANLEAPIMQCGYRFYGKDD